jgi:hypothetical protein
VQSRRKAGVFDSLICRATSFRAIGSCKSSRISTDFATARDRYCVRSFGVAAGTAFWRVFFEEDVLEDGIV